MNYMIFPMLIFFAIELVAFAQGLSAFVTFGAAGVLACSGMQVGWWAWERAKRMKTSKTDEPKEVG